MYQVRIILLPFILAILLAYLINPLIEKLIERGLPRLGALILIFGVLISLLILIFVTVFPAIINELDTLTHKLPDYAQHLEDIIDDLNHHYQQVELPSTVTLILDKTIRRFEEITLQFIERTSKVIIGLLSRMFSLVMGPILAFYILKDFDMLQSTAWSLVPKKNRKGIRELMARINIALFGFFKGQLIVSLLVGLLSILGLYLLKIKFYLIVGILTGILNVIPYFGPLFGALLASIIAAFTSTKLILWVILLFFLIQQIEGSVIAPKIMGEEVGLHPIIIIFALLAGGELLGIIGMLIAIPIAAIIKEVLRYIIYEVLISVDNR